MSKQTYSRVAKRIQSHIGQPGGAVTIISSGDGGGASGDYLPLDGTGTMAGNLDMGGNNIDDVNTINGFDFDDIGNASHARQHNITSTDDHTITSAKFGLVGATDTNTIGILTPSAAPGAAEAILKSTSSGGLTLPTFTATTSVTTPVVASTGDLKLDPNGGDVWVDGNVGVRTETPDSLLTVAGAHSNTIAHMHADNGTNPDAHLYLWASEPVKTFTGAGISNNWRYSSGWARQETGIGASYIRLLDAKVEIHTVNSSGADYQSITINSAGKVGVFDATPSYELDVTGDIRATSSMLTPTVATITGDLTLAPADDIMLDPTSNLVKATSGVSLQADNYASQVSGWRITYDGQADFRYIYTDELHAKAFIADLEQALAGGQIIAKSVTILYSDFTAPAAGGTASLTVRDLPSATGMAVFVNGDYIRIREFSRSGGSLSIADCWGTVVLDTSYGTSGFDSATKTQRYTFTRSTSPNAGAMSTGNVVEADAIILDYGTSGNGFYEVNAIDGLYGANSPYSQIVTWSGHPRNQTVQARLGNLYGIWSVTGEYGLYAGEGVTDDDSYLRISSNAVRLNNVPLQLYDSGTQTVNIDATGTNIWVGPSSADKRLSWNGTTLAIEGDIVITGGSGIASLSDAGSLATADDLDDVSDGSTYKRTNANEKTGAGRAYTAINSSNNLVTSVIPETAVTPSGAGLYLGSDYMGYYDSSVWKTYIANNGDFRFAGNAAGNYIQWDASANKLQGVGSTVEQWYADATNGKLYAGAGATWLDVDGVNILADTTTTHASQSNAKAITFERDNGTLVGRLTSYYISGTTTYGLDLYARSPNQEATFATFGAEQAGTSYAGGSAGAPRVVAYNASGGGDELRLYSSGTIKLFNSGSASADVTLSSGTLTTGALNSGALGVTGNITVSGTVDGVDIAAFKTAYDSHTHAYLPLSGGTLTGTLNSRSIIPTANNTYDIGSSSNYYNRLYVSNLHVGTIVGTPSYSHTHAASDITSGTLDDARLPGTQSGKTFTSSVHIDADASTVGTYNYIRWKTDNTANKRWDLIAYDKDHATTALRNDMLWTYYDGSTTYHVLSIDSSTRTVNFNNMPTVGGTAVSLSGHTHSYLPLSGGTLTGNITFSGSQTVDGVDISAFKTAYDSHNHDSRYYTETEVNSLLTGYMPTSWTLTAGGGLSGGGSGASNRTISHADTSSQVSINNSSYTVIQDVTLDDYGHVTGLASVDASAMLTGYLKADGTVTGATSQAQVFTNGISVGAAITTPSGPLRINPASQRVGINRDAYSYQFEVGSTSNTTRIMVVNDSTVQYSSTGFVLQNTEVNDAQKEWHFFAEKRSAGSATGDTTFSIRRRNQSQTEAITPFLIDESSNIVLNSGYKVGAQTYGNVLIGTSTDSGYKLNVNGDGYFADDLDVDGTLTVSPDTDVNTDLGRAKIGYATGTDTATFSHYDHNSSTAFALSQYSSGATMLNAASGQYVDIGVNATSTLTVNADRVLPRGNMQVGLGDYNRKFSDLHAFELIVENLVAQDVMATIGGRIVVAPTTYLSADVALAGANTFTAEHNNLFSGDFAYMAAFIDGLPQVEYLRLHSNPTGGGPYSYSVERQAQASNTTTLLNSMTSGTTTMDTVGNSLAVNDYVQLSDYANAKLETVRVTAGPTVITGGYRYTVTRNATSLATGAKAWNAGQGVKIISKLWYEGNAIVMTGGNVGEGYIELASTETLLSQYGPTISITSRTDADVWNGLKEVVALGNLRSRVDYGGNEDYGLVIGNDTSLTPTTGFSGITADASDGLRLFNTDIALYNGGTQTVDISATGNIKAGTDVSSAATTSFDFDSDTGALRVGFLGTDKPNLYYNASAGTLSLRNNTTDAITLYSDGSSYFTGVMQIGTSGEIRQGSGTFGSDFTGLRIWRDSGVGRIAGYSSDTAQWYAGSDGKMYAGAGAVKLDNNGVSIAANTSLGALENRRSVNFFNGSELIGQLSSYADATYGEGVYLASTFTTGGSGKRRLELAAFSPNSDGQTLIRAVGNSIHNASIDLTASSAGVTEIYISADDVVINGDLDLNGNDLTDIGSIGDEWVNITTFGTGWGNYSGSFQSAQYKKVGDLIFLRGMIARTSGSGTTMLTMPSGYRIYDDDMFAQATNTGYGEVQMIPGGALILNSGGTGWVSLAGIVYSTI